MQPSPATLRGFTLVELMLAVLIVGLLAAIAVPSYIDQVRKSRRADAYEAMARVQQAQERHRSQNLRYADSLSDLGLGAQSLAGHYRLELSEVSANGFTLRAVPSPEGRQAGDQRCAQFLLTVAKGVQNRSALSRSGADSSSPCWPQ